MADLNVKVDMGRVQSSVQAAIRPAVETALAECDIKAIIIAALQKPAPARSDRSMFRMMYGYDESTGSMLEQLVQEGIQAIAKEYVERELRMQRGEIEEAFRKMMNGSTNRLVKAFAGSVEEALKSDWGFNLKVEVTHTTAERERDD